jgi:hypothetical protein
MAIELHSILRQPPSLVAWRLTKVDRDAALRQLGGLRLGAGAVVVVDELHERARAQLILAPPERLRPR